MNDHEREILTIRATNLLPAEQSVHNNFTHSVNELRKDLVRTAYYLLQIQERRIHKKLGFPNLADYTAKFAGLTARQTREFVAIARRLPRFPEVEAALRDGRLSWTQARLITRRAEPAQQARWISEAQKVSVRELEKRMPPRLPAPVPKPSQPEPRPSPPPGHLSRPAAKAENPPEEQRHYFTFSFSAEQLALFSRLLAAANGEGKEEKILNALAADSKQGGSSSVPYLLVVMHCPTCGLAAMPTGRGEACASRALLEAAHCDAFVEDAAGNRRQVIPPRLRRQALQRARYCCEAAGCDHNQFLEIHHRVPAAAGGANDPDNLIVLCSGCHRRLHADEVAARAALRNVPI